MPTAKSFNAKTDDEYTVNTYKITIDPSNRNAEAWKGSLLRPRENLLFAARFFSPPAVRSAARNEMKSSRNRVKSKIEKYQGLQESE